MWLLKGDGFLFHWLTRVGIFLACWKLLLVQSVGDDKRDLVPTSHLPETGALACWSLHHNEKQRLRIQGAENVLRAATALDNEKYQGNALNN